MRGNGKREKGDRRKEKGKRKMVDGRQEKGKRSRKLREMNDYRDKRLERRDER